MTITRCCDDHPNPPWNPRSPRGQYSPVVDSGVTLWQADRLIAATAAAHRAVLATGNPEDFPMPSLDVQHWPVGQ